MAKALKKPKKKPATGYKMPEPLPEGEVLTDISKRQWRLGTSIGKGGFGEIYSAQEASKASKFPFVIKVEPHGNGPLFVEMHFYMKNAKKADIEVFKKKHKLKTFGMPSYIGSGSHEFGNVKYRFIVMEKFGSDIERLRQQNGGILPISTVYQLAWQMTYVLEYIHESGYVHADIKGANILLGITTETRNQAYLVDFGLAAKFSVDKEFKPNPKKAHDGTIEYLSRDAHQGVPTRRGDLEILGYNIIHWLCGKLPWEANLNDPSTVEQIKIDKMKDISQFLKTCFNSSTAPSGLVKFLKYVDNLKFNEEPNYKKIRDLFKQEIEKNGSSVNDPLEFQSPRKRRSLTDRETPEKKTKEEERTPKKDSKKEKMKVKKQKEEAEAKKTEQDSDLRDEDDEEEKQPKVKGKGRKKIAKKEVIENGEGETLTDAMKEILSKKAKISPKRKKGKNNVIGESSKTDTEQAFEGFTPEMIEIKMKKMNNEKKSKKKTDSSGGPRKNGENKTEPRSRRNIPVVNYKEEII
ncbi:serine/threonine-protein kinase VRK1 [Asbolus verrucosus]|uniref:non-specific serine/threonine protein kinase n=1 Tax=Asbolus verrucosus TaxID=1661398 RepID=A0A482W6K2_ASBVE|nr:serine/threonine-protein kinase VRK1 [Asbolus verrucosus]